MAKKAKGFYGADTFGDAGDPMAQAAAQLFGDIQGIGGNNTFSIGDMLGLYSNAGGGAGNYTPVSAPGVGSVGGFNPNVGALRTALSADARAARSIWTNRQVTVPELTQGRTKPFAQNMEYPTRSFCSLVA